MSIESAPKQTPEPTPKEESKEEQGVLSVKLRRNIANRVRQYQTMRANLSKEVPEHKVRNIVINFRRTIIDAIKIEHKNFHLYPDPSYDDEDWLDKLMDKSPLEIANAPIKLPTHFHSEIGFVDPEVQDHQKRNRRKPEDHLISDASEDKRRTRRVRTKDAHVMNAPDSPKDEPMPGEDIQATTKRETPKFSKPEPKEIDEEKKRGGGGEPPEEPPIEKKALKRASQLYKELSTTIQYFEKKPKITQKNIDGLKEGLYQRERVAGLDMDDLERRNKGFGNRRKGLLSRVQKLEARIGQPAREANETDTPVVLNDEQATSSNDFAEQDLAKQPTASEKPTPDDVRVAPEIDHQTPQPEIEKDLPSVESLLKDPKIAEQLENYRIEIEKFKTITVSKKSTARQQNEALFQLWIADEKLFKVIKDANPSLNLAMSDQPYKDLRDSALAEKEGDNLPPPPSKKESPTKPALELEKERIEDLGLEEKLDKALGDDEFMTFAAKKIEDIDLSKKREKESFILNWQAFRQKDAIAQALAKLYREKLENTEVVPSQESEEARKAKIDAMVFDDPSALLKIPMQIESFDQDSARTNKKEEKINLAIAKIQESLQQSKEKVARLEEKIDHINYNAQFASKVEKIKRKAIKYGGYFSAFLGGVFDSRDLKGAKMQVAKRIRALKAWRRRNGQMSPEEIVAEIRKRKDTAQNELNQKSQFEADINTLKGSFLAEKRDLLQEFEPIKKYRNELREQATKRLQQLLNGDLESLQKAKEYLQELKDNKLMNYFGDDSQEYIDTAETRQSGAAKTKNKVATRGGEKIFTPEEIQRELNFRIRAEVMTILDKKMEKLEKNGGQWAQLKEIINSALKADLATRAEDKKDVARKIISSFLEMKLHSLSPKQRVLALRIRSLQTSILNQQN